VAVVTRHVDVRGAGVVVPLRDPVFVAEDWSMVDRLTRGRAGIAFSPGWVRKDFALGDVPYEERGARMLAAVEAFRRLWRGESIERETTAGGAAVLELASRPVQPEAPVWISVVDDRELFAEAGRIGAGVLVHVLGQPLGELRDLVNAYRDAWRPTGVPARPHVAAVVHAYVAADGEDVVEIVRPAFASSLRTYASMWLGSLVPTGADDADLADRDFEFLAERAFARALESSALLGPAAVVADRLAALREAGVDEVGCLVDFGLERALVVEGIRRLAALR